MPETSRIMPETSRNLYQRLNDIAAEVDVIPEKVRMPSNMGGGMGLGIDEVEQIVGPLLTKHGVLTVVGVHNIQPHAENRTLWDVDGVVTLVNVDEPTDRLDVPVRDIGPSPTGAGSFAIKALYRRLFHFVGGDDQPAARSEGNGQRREQPAQQRAEQPQQRAEPDPNRPITDAQRETIGKLCRLLNRPTPDALSSLTFAQAGAIISDYSRQWEEARKSAV